MSYVDELTTVMTPLQYRAPEQFSKQILTQETEVWHFGIIIYLLLTAQPIYGWANEAGGRTAIYENMRKKPSVYLFKNLLAVLDSTNFIDLLKLNSDFVLDF